MKVIEDADLKKEVDRLARLAVKLSGRKKEEILKAVESDTDYDKLESEVETGLDEKRDADLTKEFNKGRDKVVGMLSKTLKKAGFDGKIESLDTETFTKIQDFIAGKQKDNDDDDTDPKKKDDKDAVIQQLKADLRKAKTEYDDLADKHEQELSNVRKASQMDLIQRDSAGLKLEALKRNNAIIPKDAEAAKKREQKYLKDFEEYDLESDGKGDFYLLKKGTEERVKTDAGKSIRLSEKANELVNVYYDVSTVQQKSGNKNDKADGKADGGSRDDNDSSDDKKFVEYKGKIPKTEAEYMEILANPKTDSKALVELVDAYDSGSLKFGDSDDD